MSPELDGRAHSGWSAHGMCEGYESKAVNDRIEIAPIRDLDLSPFVLGEIEGRYFRLRPIGAFSFLPALTDDEQFVCLEYAPWNLNAFAHTRTELLAELKEQLLMLWVEYARERDEVLSESAKQVKRQLLADWEEIANA